jgi:glyoxylate reductase
MTPRILVTHPLVPGGLARLEGRYTIVQGEGLEQAEALRAAIRGCVGVIPVCSARIDASVIESGDALRVIANCAVGFDNVDLAAAARRGVVVTNTPGVLTEATADLTWAAILGLVRRVVAGDRLVRSGAFRGFGPTLLLGIDLAGKTLGIVGLGQIGHAVARRAVGFGLEVLYVDPDREEPAFRRAASLEALLARADIVTLHTPLLPGTRHLIDARRLALLKATAYLVNTSRGPIVDERALVDALRAGRLAGAALDVYEREPELAAGLAELENVLLLPHLGSATVETRRRMAELAAANLDAVLSGSAPLNPVPLA